MINHRHPAVAGTMVQCLSDPQGFRHFSAAAACLVELCAVGYDAPEWRALVTAQPRIVAERLQGVLALPAEGWQHEASMAVEKIFLDSAFLPELVPRERAFLLSQGGPLAGLPFTAVPVCPHLRFDSDLFSVLLLRRLPSSSPVFTHLPVLPLVSTALAITAQVARGRGVLGRRGYALESAAARICREAGARVSTNVSGAAACRTSAALRSSQKVSLRSTAPSWPSTQPSCLPLRADGVPHRRCADESGAALVTVRRREERTYPELSGESGRAKLVVLAGEIGCRSHAFALSGAAYRWGSMLACAAARAFASSLLDRRGHPGRMATLQQFLTCSDGLLC